MTLLFRKRRRRTAWIFWKVILELTHPSSVSRKNLGKTDWKIVKISWNQYFSRYNPPRHVSCFHELFVMWKNEKFSLTKKFFRQINSLVTYLVKPLLSRNFCQKCVRENSRTLHNFQFQFSLKFREINLYCNADFTNIFTFGGKFRNFQMLLLLSHFAHLQSNSWNQFFVRFIIKSSDETLNSTTFTQLDLKCYKYVIDL